MTKLEMVQNALTNLGEVPAEKVAAFVERKYGTRIEPKFIPLFKASIQDKERLDAARQSRLAAHQAVTEH